MSFGPIYGDMFDHHSVVYEYANGTRLYAFHETTQPILTKLNSPPS